MRAKVRAVDYELVDKDGMRVLNAVDVFHAFTENFPSGRIEIRDGFNPYVGGRCLVAGEEYYLILDGGQDEFGAAAYDMGGHPLTQLAVRGGRIVVPPGWESFWPGGELDGMSEVEFVEELERALASRELA
ncbi:MAG: hypothetical protein HY678_03055 [Chloroflexi bacterium]|nr:hypothetical protein [Chloroflexota bacterium]